MGAFEVNKTSCTFAKRSREGEGNREVEEEEGEKKSSLFKSELQGGVREEAVIRRRVGKWRVKASRGCSWRSEGLSMSTSRFAASYTPAAS